jgi:hypothetical protein
MPKYIIKIDNRELAAVLAGLRLFQSRVPNVWIDEIATVGRTVEPLSSAEIDDLCARLNVVPA